MCRCATLVTAKTDNTKPCARKTDCCQKRNDKNSARERFAFVFLDNAKRVIDR